MRFFKHFFLIVISLLLVVSVASYKDDDDVVVIYLNNPAENVEPGEIHTNDSINDSNDNNDSIIQGDTIVLPGFDQDGASLALFSISPSKQVRFSRGNLQYQPSTGTWRFAEHQYDYIGLDNENISANYNGWIDLFGWGTSGWNSGAIAYQPWSISTTSSDYYPGGDWTNNLAGDYIKADWGRYNKISNGGNQANKWRALKSYEWKYLLITRDDAEEKYGLASIDGIHGMVILPDNWAMPSGVPFFVPGCDGWYNNSYDFAQWDIMEEAGAIFLPAAGKRSGTNVSQTESCGAYWSTIHNDENTACIMFFLRDVMRADRWYAKRYVGLSVRLVTW